MVVTADVGLVTNRTFDYVIAGGGTAGLVLASRLTEDENVTVLVVEAGKDHHGDEAVLTPGLAASLKNRDEYDWAFVSTPQDALNGRRIHQGRGKGLGGSSAINGVMAMYPSRASVDAWAELGNDGWSFDDILPYLEKFSQLHRPSEHIRKLCNLGYVDKLDDASLGRGPVQTSFGENLDTLNAAWIQAWNDALETTADDNPRDGQVLGGFQCAFTVDPRDGTRSHAGTAYLGAHERQRPNLTVLINTMVAKVLFDGQSSPLQATGVALCPSQDRANAHQQVFARREVLLASGALQSPQILELSGVGSAEVLRARGIPLILENPAVGESLQDHPLTCQSFEVMDEARSIDDLLQPGAFDESMAEFRTSGTGPLGHPSISVAYIPADNHDTTEAYEEKNAAVDDPVSVAARRTRQTTHRALRSPTGCATQSVMIPALHKTPESLDPPPSSVHSDSRCLRFLSINTLLHQPFSRGSVHIASPDVHDLPVYDPQILSHPHDKAILTKHVLQVNKLFATPPFSTQVIKPGGVRYPDLIVDNEDAAAILIRDHTRTMYHTSGSCAMLPKESGGVVDAHLVVHGTSNLRVVDASIFPLETQGNIMCMVYAVAEKAADLIKRSHQQG